ncbi:MAG: hypothetical protein F6K35_19045 [Okeania sp. SIO2H7]|nr:hypothetical protein [Okeania sp. SIO2H7]
MFGDFLDYFRGDRSFYLAINLKVKILTSNFTNKSDRVCKVPDFFSQSCINRNGAAWAKKAF